MENLTLYDPINDQTYTLQVTYEVHKQVMEGDMELANQLLLIAQKQADFKTAFKVMSNEVNSCTVGATKDPTNCYETETTEETSETEIERPTPPIAETAGRSSYNQNCERSNMWDKPRTLYLLSKALDKKEKLENPRFKKSAVFQEIADEMRSQNYMFTGEQCQNRMKTLISKYKTIKDHNNTSGMNAKEWEYFDIISTYLGDRPSVQPQATCSSLALSRNDETSESSEPAAKKRKVMKRSTPRSEMLKWLKQQSEERKEMENRKLQQAAQQHNENKELLKELLEIFKSKNL